MREATRRLLELGLSEKEASVYLALLELGPSSVQDLAEKASVNRSTAYALLGTLKFRGLVSESDRDGRTLFSPETPHRLGTLLDDEERQVASKRQSLSAAMPDFLALYNAIDGKPRVRFFEGNEGIATAREILIDNPDEEFLSFTAIDEGTEAMSKIDERERQRLARRLHGRLIISIKPGQKPPETDFKNWQVREIPYDSAPFTGEVDIYGDKVAAFVVRDHPMGFLVESKELSKIFRALFEAAWKEGKPWKLVS